MARDTEPASTATPMPFSAWKNAVAAALAERGIRATSIRGRTWRNLYIRKLSPAEAADRAAADYKRRGR